MKKLWVLIFCLLPALALADDPEDILANPGTVQAVQNRLFRMDHELTLGIGVLPLDAFYKGLTVQLGYTYHFSDSFAWRVGRGLYSYDVNTGLENQLERDFKVKPTTQKRVSWMVGSDLMWTPVYAKASWLNSSVAHFEIFGLLGASVIKFDTQGGGSLLDQFKPAVHLGLGIRLFASNTVSYRLDVADDVVISKDGIDQVGEVQLSLALNFGSLE